MSADPNSTLPLVAVPIEGGGVAFTDGEPIDEANDGECPNCGGLGIVAGCFEDSCSGADCDPEDAEYCCAPSLCDWCKPGGSAENADAD